MLQFYFLSVFFNLIAGFVLVNDKKEIIDLAILKDKTFRIVLGAVCAVTGYKAFCSSKFKCSNCRRSFTCCCRNACGALTCYSG